MIYFVHKKNAEVIIMNNEMKDKEFNVAKLKFRACGTVTCLHNIDSKCMLKNCDMYEKSLRQEY